MSRITFFIGNGFDINVGLKTGYSDFYNYYVKRQPTDVLAQSIGKEHELWSDLEMGLGEYTKKVSKGTIDSFFTSKKLLQESLADYLEEQMNSITGFDNKEVIGKQMRESIYHFEKNLELEDQKEIEKVLNTIQETIYYSFINFNYTTVFDRCLEIARDRYRVLGNHKGYNCMLNKPGESEVDIIHIHGTTEGMILGVNDAEQIKNPIINEDSWYQKLLIKKMANEDLKEDRIGQVQERINSSEVICIFGMSLGETDKIWWKYIAQWLQAEDKHRLVIFAKQNNTWERHEHLDNWFATKREVCDSFRKNSDIDDSNWKEIENRIIVKVNANLFNFKLVKE